MKNLIVFIFTLLSFSTSVSAQIHFNIDLLADKETYLVSFISEEDISSPKNYTANIQVVLKVPIKEDVEFLAENIESYISTVSWINDVHFNVKNVNQPYQLLSFSMTQASTKSINYKAGEITPLFSFKNKFGGCIGEIVLPDNKDEVVLDALSRGLNFTQSITTLNKRGNSFAGVENGTVDCLLASGLTEEENDLTLRAFPIPTKDFLFVEWDNPNGYKELKIEVLNMYGQVLSQQEVAASKGLHNDKIEVGNFSEGLYAFRLIKKKIREN